MIVVPSQPIIITRDQTNSSGLPAASAHTAKLWKNGVETAEVVTPAATLTVGVYSFSFTIPADAVQYDVWSLRVVDNDGHPATVWEGVTGVGDATLANQVLILADLASITSALAATTVTVTGYASIDSDGVLQLKRAHTATLTFTSDSADLVPDLSVTNTKIVLGIKDPAGRVWLSLEGTVLVATGLQSVRFVLTPALSLALIKGHHNFDVLAVYGYNAELVPPYASLQVFTSGRVTVTDVYLDPLEL